MYLSYDDYLDRGGEMDEAAFAAAELRARKRVDALTAGRVAALAARGDVPEAVKLAMLTAIRADGAVGAEALAASDRPVAFTTDGYSERYDGAGERTAAVERQLAAELVRLLTGEVGADGVPLLYRGIGRA